MYWIALVAFVGAVLTPEIITSTMASVGGLREDEWEVLVLAFLVGVMFLIFLWRDRAFRASRDQGRLVKQEVRDGAQDLQHSYKYIGTINRKIEIVERIAQIIARADASDCKTSIDKLLTIAATITKSTEPNNTSASMRCSLIYLDTRSAQIVHIYGRKVTISTARWAEIAQYTGSRNYSKSYRITPSTVTRHHIRAFVITPICGETPDNDWLLRTIATHAMQLMPIQK